MKCYKWEPNNDSILYFKIFYFLVFVSYVWVTCLYIFDDDSAFICDCCQIDQMIIPINQYIYNTVYNVCSRCF